MQNTDLFNRLIHEARADCDLDPGFETVATIDLHKLISLCVEECIKLVQPSPEHEADASWGYLGGEEGVELLHATVDEIREHFGV